MHSNAIASAAPERPSDTRVTFAGAGITGSLALSQSHVLADKAQRVYAELRVKADEATVGHHAPLAMAILLDTSGSMSGIKIEEGKRSVATLIAQMEEDDQVAVIRYADSPASLQPLARVGDVRGATLQRLRFLDASGGTNIPPALEAGLLQLDQHTNRTDENRVKRLVLVSDGLDSNRPLAESIARGSMDDGVTVSTLGIGLDFDESYMSGVARAGRGNFSFVENPVALARFLNRELHEATQTTIERATARLHVPRQFRLLRVVGAQERKLDDGSVELTLGALFGGDERRITLELEADGAAGESLAIDAQLRWTEVGGKQHRADLKPLSLVATNDPHRVAASRDSVVFADATSVLASVRQLEAASAYQRGEVEVAEGLIDSNVAALEEAAKAVPSGTASRLREQIGAYGSTKHDYHSAPPKSTAGKAAAKRSADTNSRNLGKPVYGSSSGK